MENIFEVDGSFGEGGGQVLRNSTALAALLGINLKISKIRAGRSVPGLRQQHLSGMQLVTKLCSGDLKGGKVKSEEVEFSPSKLNSKGKYQSIVQSAGYFHFTNFLTNPQQEYRSFVANFTSLYYFWIWRNHC
jgi:RNA 3'-terminal phosphate cyclase (ATP)